MKKTIIFIICVVIIILSVFGNKYLNYREEKSLIKKENLEYETYLNKEVSGRDLTTAINRAVNSNEKNKVSKDENGLYTNNDINSISIEIKISDNDQTYKMETLYNGGMVTFIQYYGDISFECKKIDYNSKGRVSYMLFEQKTN
jgi:exopolysaccharide biosynthesis protein